MAVSAFARRAEEQSLLTKKHHRTIIIGIFHHHQAPEPQIQDAWEQRVVGIPLALISERGPHLLLGELREEQTNSPLLSPLEERLELREPA